MSWSRIIKPGQKVHVSVCFMNQESYKPRATFDLTLANEVGWVKIIEIGRTNSTSWAEGVEEFIEMNVFDVS